MLKFATCHRQSRTYGFSWIAYTPSVVPATVLTNFELKLKSLKKRISIADSARTSGHKVRHTKSGENAEIFEIKFSFLKRLLLYKQPQITADYVHQKESAKALAHIRIKYFVDADNVTYSVNFRKR